jgi:putative copper resistance protein D
MADLPVIGIRFALYAALMLLTGLAAFPLYTLRGGERGNRLLAAMLVRVQRWLCGLGLLVSTAGIVVLTANMHGVGLSSVEPEMLRIVLVETDLGAAWLVRTAALLVAAIAAWNFARRPRIAATMLAAAGAAALATLTWSGHAGATEGLTGAVHRISDALHMIAAAIWLGAIAAFLILLRPRRHGLPPKRIALAARSLDQFGRVGTICVLVITATGLVNAQLILGLENAGQSIASTYGQLLLVKLLLFGAMLALAAANRWRLTPALKAASIDADSSRAAAAIRRSIIAEAAAAGTILALVAWFGTLEP